MGISRTGVGIRSVGINARNVNSGGVSPVPADTFKQTDGSAFKQTDGEDFKTT